VFVVVFSQSGVHVPRKPTPGGKRTGTLEPEARLGTLLGTLLGVLLLLGVYYLKITLILVYLVR
jgi:hypothetical protein